MLPIYEKSAQKSECVRLALETAQAYLAKEKKLAEVKAAAKEVMAGKTTRIVAIRTGCGQSDQLVAQLHFHTDQRTGDVFLCVSSSGL